jgi:hypothetical protein
MARKKLEAEKVMTLEELIPEYGEKNAECNALKKVVSDLNSKVKTAIHLALKENEDIEIDGWKCKLSIEESTEMNEDKLIEFAKAHKLNIIKKREYIDSDALEKLIYSGAIPKNILVEMNSCKEVKTKEVLRISKAKEV